MITPKYEIGQQVYYGTSSWGYTLTQCPDCLGKGEWTVTTPAGESWQIACGTCPLLGKSDPEFGKIRVWNFQPVVERLTVGSIRTDTNDCHPVSYMMKETGVGSGSVYREEDLFLTEAEAKAHALQRMEAARKCKEEEEQEKEQRSRHRESSFRYSKLTKLAEARNKKTKKKAKK